MNTSTGVTTTTIRLRALRRTVALAMVACGATLVVAPTMAGAEDVEGEPVSRISIVQTPSEAQGECLPALLSLSNTVASTDKTFTLTIIASAPLCEPVDATAVVYAMPGDGVAWPQELAEKKSFTISEAGTTVVTFTKDCEPAQFDVIAGATPQTIYTPLDHGPLLFPFDVGTAEQYWGCTPDSTTSTTTTTTSTTTTTTTSVPPQVLGSTTIAPAVAGASTSTTPPQAAAVQGVSANRANAAALALTGSGTSRGVMGGVILIAVGALLFAASRRRRAEV